MRALSTLWKRRLLAATSLGLALALAAAPARAAPPLYPGLQPDFDMQEVLNTYAALGALPVYETSVARARTQPTIWDAVQVVYENRTLRGYVPTPVALVQNIQVQGAAGPLAARIYDPNPGHGAEPVILYFHGGGWVIGTLDTYDMSQRALAAQTGAIVLTVQYRQGPEVRFPGAHDDAFAAYKWLLANAATINADPSRIALAGESAGGNLAIDTAIAARDAALPMPVHEVLIYPVAGTDLNTLSYDQTVQAQPLNRRAIQWFVNRYISSPADLKDPRLDVVGKADLKGLPPTTIISAEIDPLRSESVNLQHRLQAAGDPVVHAIYSGVTHEFFGMGIVVPEAARAEALAATRLKAAFGTGP